MLHAVRTSVLDSRFILYIAAAVVLHFYFCTGLVLHAQSREDAAGAGPEKLVIVRFSDVSRRTWRETLGAHGGEIVGYEPVNAHLVRISAAQIQNVQNLPFVESVVEYPAERKLATGWFRPGFDQPDQWLRLNLLTTRVGHLDKPPLVEFLVRHGARVLAEKSPLDRLLVVELKTSLLHSLLERPEVLAVDEYGGFESDMDLVRASDGAAYVEAVGGFRGAGVRAEVLDQNLFSGHADFQALPPLFHGVPSGDAVHGTSVYGILFADGTADESGSGLLPDAQGIFGVADPMLSRYQQSAELLTAPYFAVFQSASLGSPLTPNYNTLSADMDQLTFELDLLVCQSMGNSGGPFARPEAWAKNVLAVGGVRHFDTLSLADDSWTQVASHGPAGDGRIKPDFCGFADSIATPTVGTPFSYRFDFGGTSAATPIVAGHLGLLHEMWHMGLFANPVNPGGSVFQNRPHAATARALLANTASPYPFSGATADFSRFHQGWGRPDVRRLYDERERLFVIDESVILSEFETRAFEFQVTPVDADFAITMVYSDPPANPTANIHRVNDLTLRVFAPDGTTYWGNHGLDIGNVSIPGGSPDSINTTEHLVVLSPMPGIWRIEVRAVEVNQDGHLETSADDVDFGLVVRGGQRVIPAPSLSGQPNSAAASLSILGATNQAGLPPAHQVPGPFEVLLSGNDLLTLRFSGTPGDVFLLLAASLNPQNRIVHAFGSLDIGLFGANNNFSDLQVLLNPLAPSTTADTTAFVPPSGEQIYTSVIPPGMMAGPVTTLQALFVDPLNTLDGKFSGATTLTVH